MEQAEKLKNLKAKAFKEIQNVKNEPDLQKLLLKYFGRKHGELTTILRSLKSLDMSNRKKIGQLANQIKQEIVNAMRDKKKTFLDNKAGELGTKGWIDVTEPGVPYPHGTIHPVTQMMNSIIDVFTAMGFEVARDYEIDSDWYNFESLNFIPDHPARDMQDTFYLDQDAQDGRKKDNNNLLLTTHTSNMQVRFMEQGEPPFKVVVPRKCFRRDSDINHTPMFHQYEGFVVGKDVALTDLKGTIHEAMKKILDDEGLEIRFRQSYFPFVEPGEEVDVTCTICGGNGCPTCKGTGWLEMLGCGMIHPNVLKNGGIDPKKWQGYAFGGGVERPFMIKHKVTDLRSFFDNDLRFLNQF